MYVFIKFSPKDMFPWTFREREEEGVEERERET